jgi:hypothetical protein
MPIFLSEAKSDTEPRLPFLFSGGFALSTSAIGFMMAVQGVYSMIAQLFLFPFLISRIGTLSAFRLVMVIWPFLYFVVPYLVLLPERLQTVGIYMALLTKMTFHTVAFPSNAILLANAAPSKSVLGSINGVAASTACLSRAMGPTVSGGIHALGLKFGCTGLAWWAGGIVCAFGALESFCIQEQEDEEQPLCEPLIHGIPQTDDEEPGAQQEGLLTLNADFDDSKTLVESITSEGTPKSLL